MNKFLTTASIISAGILVGVVARRISQPSLNYGKPTTPESLKPVKSVFDKNASSEDVNNYFV
ncbi:MAG: hypothetical protein U5K79_12670 [Cyclobacteriaceae bacterium]|nr:hypothetical protein [Cyclobacteriaceae bacterium]